MALPGRGLFQHHDPEKYKDFWEKYRRKEAKMAMKERRSSKGDRGDTKLLPKDKKKERKRLKVRTLG